MQKTFDILGKVIALVWLVNFVLWVTNANWGYLNDIAILVKIINGIKEWGALLLVAVTGCEAVAKRNLIIKIIFLVLLVACVIFMFFPGATDQIFNYVDKL